MKGSLYRIKSTAAPPVVDHHHDLEHRIANLEQELARLRRSLTVIEPGSYADTMARTMGAIVADLRARPRSLA
jgi:hypothetical protein